MKLSSIFKKNRILNSKKSVSSQKITQLPSSGCYFNEQRLKCLTKIPKILFSHNNYTKKDQGIKLKAEKSFLNHVVSQRTHFLCCLLDVELLLMKRAVNNNFLRNSHWMNVWKGENGRKNQEKITSEAMNFTHTRTHSTIWTNVGHYARIFLLPLRDVANYEIKGVIRGDEWRNFCNW